MADRIVDRWPLYTTLWSPPSCLGLQPLDQEKKALIGFVGLWGVCYKYEFLVPLILPFLPVSP